MRITIMLTVILLVFGCITSGVKYNFPPDLNDWCYGAQNESKVKIESVGTVLESPGSCTVVKHDGDQKFGPMWCWYDNQWKQFIGGLCWGSKIEIGCNPVTKNEVQYPVLLHEFAHYWLMPLGIRNHDAKYSGLFQNWKDTTASVLFISAEGTDVAKVRVAREMKKIKSGEWLSVSGTDKNGIRYHIDFVKE